VYSVTPDSYLADVLSKYAVPWDHVRQVELTVADLYPYIHQWAGERLIKVQYSGSFAKGTTIRGGTDVDLFISLRHNANDSLHHAYNSLYNALNRWKLNPRKQNVSIGLTLRGLNIDLVPARKHQGATQDHSLYRSRTGSWTKTNVDRHIQIVRNSGLQAEIRAMKVWRQLHGLEFPSFYLELATIQALPRHLRTELASNIWRVFHWLVAELKQRRLLDPANPSNIVSNDLNFREKTAIVSRANWSLKQPSWGKILW